MSLSLPPYFSIRVNDKTGLTLTIREDVVFALDPERWKKLQRQFWVGVLVLGWAL